MWSAWVWSQALQAWLLLGPQELELNIHSSSLRPALCYSHLVLISWVFLEQWSERVSVFSAQAAGAVQQCWQCLTVLWAGCSTALTSSVSLPLGILKARGSSLCLFNTDWACSHCSPLKYLTVFNMYNSFSTNTKSQRFSCAISTPMHRGGFLVPLGAASCEPQSERQKKQSLVLIVACLKLCCPKKSR